VNIDAETICIGLREGTAAEAIREEDDEAYEAHTERINVGAKTLARAAHAAQAYNESDPESEPLVAVDGENATAAMWSFGAQMAREFGVLRRDWQLDVDSVCAGLRGDAACNHDNREEIEEAFRADYMQFRFSQKLKQSYLKSRIWLDTNAEKESVTCLPSGLQYEKLRSGGSTDHPAPGDKVKLHVEAMTRLMNGFYNSREKGGPREYLLASGSVLECWLEGLQLMAPGDMYRFYCPAELAYGDNGFPKDIRPGEVAVFELDLLAITRAADLEEGEGVKQIEDEAERTEL
jgi:FKBP-type peptidyl-prolyl cis-trans isomerase